MSTSTSTSPAKSAPSAAPTPASTPTATRPDASPGRRHRVLSGLERRGRVVPRSARALRAAGRRVVVAAGDAGMATAEYAIVTLAAVGFAGLLVVILKGNEVKALLLGLIRQALGQ